MNGTPLPSRWNFLTCMHWRATDQYSFLGGNDRFIYLRSRATAVAFFLLRLAVGVS